MQTESADRQGYPLYNGVKMVEKYSGSATLSASVPGLTASQVLEGVAFSYNNYYDMLQFMTNSGKLRNVQGGLKWFTMTRDRPVRKFNLRMRSSTKAINPYTFHGVMVTVPSVDTGYQLPVSGDTTNVNHVAVSLITRYNEWNPDFNFKKVWQ